MWGGIIVQAGGKVNMSNSSRLEDAEFGSTANQNSTVHSTQILIKNSFFDSNFIGIFIDPISSPPNFNNITLQVTGTTFDCVNLIPSISWTYPGTLTNEGIELNDMSCILGDPYAGGNYFHNISNGIVSHRSILFVRNSEFVDITNDLTLTNTYGITTGYAITADGNSAAYHLEVINNNFNRCYIGIKTNGVPAVLNNNIMDELYIGIYFLYLPKSTSSQANGNYISSTYKGGIESWFEGPIDILEIYHNYLYPKDFKIGEGNGIGLYDNLQTKNINVINNYIQLQYSDQGIEMFGAQGNNVIENTIDLSVNTSLIDYCGISLTRSNKNIISCNNITGSSVSPTQDNFNGAYQYGYYAVESQSNSILCNTGSSISHNFEFRGLCSMPGKFDGNQMNSSYVELDLENSTAEIGSQKECGNFFIGPYNAPDDAVDVGNYISSIFDVNPSVNPYFIPVSPNPHGWFNPVTDPTTFECGRNYECPRFDDGGGGREGDRIDDFDYLIANDNYNPAEFPDESKEMAKRFLFDKIKNNSFMLNEQIFNDFYSIYKDSCLGKLSGLADSIQTVFQTSSSQASIIHDVDSTFKVLQNTIKDQDSLYSNNLIDSLVRETVSDSILHIMASLGSTIKPVNVAINDFRLSRADEISQLNLNLQTSNVMEENEKTVNDIYLNSVAKNVIRLDSVQVASLQSIIHQCPETGGTAVYLARSLYFLENPSEQYSDRDVCSQLNVLRKSHPDDISSLYSFVFPNPSNNLVTLAYKLPGSGQSELLMYNSSLKLIHSEFLNPNETQKTINVAMLQPDLYFYNIVSEKTVISSGKISVVR